MLIASRRGLVISIRGDSTRGRFRTMAISILFAGTWDAMLCEPIWCSELRTGVGAVCIGGIPARRKKRPCCRHGRCDDQPAGWSMSIRLRPMRNSQHSAAASIAAPAFGDETWATAPRRNRAWKSPLAHKKAKTQINGDTFVCF